MAGQRPGDAWHHDGQHQILPLLQVYKIGKTNRGGVQRHFPLSVSESTLADKRVCPLLCNYDCLTGWSASVATAHAREHPHDAATAASTHWFVTNPCGRCYRCDQDNNITPTTDFHFQVSCFKLIDNHRFIRIKASLMFHFTFIGLHSPSYSRKQPPSESIVQRLWTCCSKPPNNECSAAEQQSLIVNAPKKWNLVKLRWSFYCPNALVFKHFETWSFRARNLTVMMATEATADSSPRYSWYFPAHATPDKCSCYRCRRPPVGIYKLCLYSNQKRHE